jgi:hypothetical protein
MNEDITLPWYGGVPCLISQYRIVASNTGFGWFAVERWDFGLGQYAPLTSFRDFDQAREFIRLESFREKSLSPEQQTTNQ